MKYSLDFETYSEADLQKVGAYRYAKDPSAEVLCLAISRNHGKPLLWVPPAYATKLPFIDPMEQQEARAMLDEMMSDPANLVYAHNAAFEYVVWNNIMVKQHGFSPLHPEQMRCTASFARRACLPPSLGKCAAYLNLAQQKDARGSTLIRKFCIPQKPDKTHAQTWRRFPQDDPALFKDFCEYCVQDVVTELAIGDALKLFDVGGITHTAFVSDMRINDTGFPVDIAALQTASQMIDNELVRVRDEFIKLTGLNPTQTGAFLIWMREHGYQGTDLRAATMDEALEEGEVGDDGIADEDTSTMDDVAREALALRRIMSFAATKKIKSMLAVAGPDDNRVRGTLLYHGASTGRWSSRLVQQQNFKRSTDESEKAFLDLRKGFNAETMELIHGPILEVIASGIRHFINDGDAPLFSTDYSSIEARIICWLAGQQDALDEYSSGVDRYKVMAGKIFNIRPDDVTKPQRFLGKGTILGAGFGMGVSKFQATCANQGVEVPLDMAELAITTWRKSHKKVVSFWYDLERAAKSAINNPGQKFIVGKLKVFTLATAGTRFLMIRLPSGRHLSYPDPRIEDEQITFYGQIPMKQIWGRISTYGGKLAENCLTGDMLVLTQEGWMPLSSLRTQKVHDGIDFVEHGGLLRKGQQNTINHLGFTATADHKFMTKDLRWESLGCVQAKDMLLLVDEKRIDHPIQATPRKTNRPSWQKVWAPVSDLIRLHRRENLVAHAVRLRGALCQTAGGTPKRRSSRANSVLLVAMPSAQSQAVETKDYARDVKAPSIRGMAFHEAAMPGRQSPRIQELWGEGDYSLRRMGKLVCDFLGRLGWVLGEGLRPRSHRQQCGLQQSELPLDHAKGQRQQQEGERSQHRDIRYGGGERDKPLNPILAVETWRENRIGSDEKAERSREVYDIRNCGPRSRFIVKSPTTGLIAIAHNCTQAVAADVMTTGLANALAAGHTPVMLVHDEIVCTTRGSTLSLDNLNACLLDMPPWANGLPLAVEGATIEFYTK